MKGIKAHIFFSWEKIKAINYSLYAHPNFLREIKLFSTNNEGLLKKKTHN